ncbi:MULTISPECIES: hypothetical protein [Bacillus]|uniref:hypothetical protein n=1 Tax=Bacillus TaxID=1386 RepID=UPI000308DFF6|nr:MULTISPECIES: hypothetical protein [Bacillus]
MMLRSFIYDGQWNIIYYPPKPSGFAVFIIGDHHQYVNNLSSYWLQHPGRFQILEQILEQGYTGFSSNLYGEHWGNNKAVQLAKTIYQLCMKKEILNNKIHILAEGKGALVAMQLISELKGNVRSAVFLNPVLSVKQSWKKERERVIYYKPFMKSMSRAYETSEDEIETNYKEFQDEKLSASVPIKVIHVLDNDYKEQSKLYKQLQKNNQDETEILYLLPEKRYKVASEAITFFKKYEKVL